MSDFRALRSQASHDAVLFAFDLLLHEDEDLRDLALISRKQRLARLIGKAKQNAIRFVEHLIDDGAPSSPPERGVMAQLKKNIRNYPAFCKDSAAFQGALI